MRKLYINEHSTYYQQINTQKYDSIWLSPFFKRLFLLLQFLYPDHHVIPNGMLESTYANRNCVLLIRLVNCCISPGVFIISTCSVNYL